MTQDKKIEQLIAYGNKKITIEAEKYKKLKPETINLIKLNNVEVIILEDIDNE